MQNPSHEREALIEKMAKEDFKHRFPYMKEDFNHPMNYIETNNCIGSARRMLDVVLSHIDDVVEIETYDANTVTSGYPKYRHKIVLKEGFRKE